MGKLVDRKIVQSRTWLDGKQTTIPSYDYDYTYPISVYAAIHSTMDDDSPTLEDELSSIYRLINEKQPLIEAGTPGNIMSWSGIPGQIGSVEIVKKIEDEPANRSLNKLASERAIGDALDTKVDLVNFNYHVDNNAIHITDIERQKWNQSASMSALQAHASNTAIHTSNEERARWNNKAEQKELDDHIFDLNNPHNVTAHQVNAYTQHEIDEMFNNIRESFFNYMNISWDSRVNQASLVEYAAMNWNPNYVLSYDDKLPEVSDPTIMYFALKPATNYKVEESDDCVIYCKRPGLSWQEVGFQSMNVGDMVIKYPDTGMYVWVQGRFLQLFTDSNIIVDGDGNTGSIGGDGTITVGGGDSTLMWRPSVTEDGILTWTRSKTTEAPPATIIKGKDGYTPIKGVDYEDGADGVGVPIGGRPGEILTKLTEDNYDTAWKPFSEVLSDMLLAGETFPEGFITWDSIVGRPVSYDTLGTNENGFMTQKAVSDRFDYVDLKIQSVMDMINGSNSIDKINQALKDHIDDVKNPHHVTPQQIGAATVAELGNHVSSFDNPHNVTATQLGLGNVDNTSDLDKPISTAVREELNDIRNLIRDLDATGSVGGGSGTIIGDYIEDVVFNESTSTFIFTYNSGEEKRIQVELTPNLFRRIEFDDKSRELVFTLMDGTETRVSITALTCKGSTSDNIFVDVDNDNTIKATIVPSSIGKYEITPSVELRGSPTTTTQPNNDKSARIATTEFVKNLTIDTLNSYEVERPLSANMGRILNQEKASLTQVYDILGGIEGISVLDTLDSTSTTSALSANRGRELNLTKAPRVHTSTEGSTFGRAALGLWGHVKPSEIEPLMDGTSYVGDDDGTYARGNHRHHTDITRAPIHFPDRENNIYSFTGEPRATTPPDDSNDDRIVTTEWMRKNGTTTYFGICDTESTDRHKIAYLKSSVKRFEVPFELRIGATVAVEFKYVDKSTRGKITTLNVADTGDVEIHYGGKELRDKMIGTNYTHLFTYDGTYWNLINPAYSSFEDDEYTGCECNYDYEPSPSVLKLNKIIEHVDAYKLTRTELDDLVALAVPGLAYDDYSLYTKLEQLVEVAARATNFWNEVGFEIPPELNMCDDCQHHDMDFIRVNSIVNFTEKTRSYYDTEASWIIKDLPYTPSDNEADYIACSILKTNELVNSAVNNLKNYNPLSIKLYLDPSTCGCDECEITTASGRVVDELVDFAFKGTLGFDLIDVDLTVEDGCGCNIEKKVIGKDDLENLVDFAYETKDVDGTKIPLDDDTKIDDSDSYTIMNSGLLWKLVKFGASIPGTATLDNPNIIPNVGIDCSCKELQPIGFIKVNQLVKQTFNALIPDRVLAA